MSGVLHGIIAALRGVAAVMDAYWKYVSLLLNTTNTNGAQNNTFIDSSSNAFTITRNGTATQGSVTPYWPKGQWGNYFNGSTDYLITPTNTALTFGTGNFTIEFWLNSVAVVNNKGIFTSSPNAAFNSNAAQISIVHNNSTSFYATYAGSSANTVTSFANVPNSWMHVALCKNSGTSTLYVNGISVDSRADSVNYTDSSFILGGWWSTAFLSNSIISNFRVIKGTAVYTANFTPPTAPLTAITNTSLLTCQSNRFIDNSTNAFALTIGGAPQVTPFCPFNPTAAYNTTTYGGSGYFDTNNSYLGIGTQAILNVGTGNFTIEAYTYNFNSTNSFGRTSILSPTEATASSGVTVRLTGSPQGSTGIVVAIAGTTVITYSTAIPPYTWNHIAVTREGTGAGQVKLYVNGVSVATGASASSISSAASYGVGALKAINSAFDDFFNGYMTDFRTASSAIYTGNFTPPAAPLTAVANTTLLLGYKNAGVYDATTINDQITAGAAQASTTQAKFGLTSMQFNGTTSYLRMPYNASLKLISGDWTIEFWMYCTGAQSSTNNGIWAQDSTGSFTGVLITADSSRQVAFSSSTTGTAWAYLFQVIGTYTDNTWNHVAITKSGTTVRGFFNGALNLTINSFPATVYSSATASDMGVYATTNFFSGYIDEFRITNGYARYTAAFTPPTAAFPTQ